MGGVGVGVPVCQPREKGEVHVVKGKTGTDRLQRIEEKRNHIIEEKKTQTIPIPCHHPLYTPSPLHHTQTHTAIHSPQCLYLLGPALARPCLYHPTLHCAQVACTERPPCVLWYEGHLTPLPVPLLPHHRAGPQAQPPQPQRQQWWGEWWGEHGWWGTWGARGWGWGWGEERRGGGRGGCLNGISMESLS